MFLTHTHSSSQASVLSWNHLRRYLPAPAKLFIAPARHCIESVIRRALTPNFSIFLFFSFIAKASELPTPNHSPSFTPGASRGFFSTSQEDQWSVPFYKHRTIPAGERKEGGRGKRRWCAVVELGLVVAISSTFPFTSALLPPLARSHLFVKTDIEQFLN